MSRKTSTAPRRASASTGREMSTEKARPPRCSCTWRRERGTSRSSSPLPEAVRATWAERSRASTASCSSGEGITSMTGLPAMSVTWGKRRAKAPLQRRMRPCGPRTSTPSLMVLSTLSSWAVLSEAMRTCSPMLSAMRFTASARGANSVPGRRRRRRCRRPREMAETTSTICPRERRMAPEMKAASTTASTTASRIMGAKTCRRFWMSRFTLSSGRARRKTRPSGRRRAA